jgi:hypothetical protein
MPSLKESDIKNLDEARAVALLRTCNDAIKRLHKKLDEQNRQKHLLEQRILSVRDKRSLFSQIPDDVMLDIFKNARYHNSLALGPILRVCRKWYNLVINSPSLWATISLEFQSASHTVGIQRRIQYAESAIRNSKAAPLDIDLTLPQVDSLIRNMIDKLIDTGDQEYDSDDARSVEIYHWLWGGIDNDCQGLPLYADISSGLCQFMAMLAGPNGENLLRLRRFKLDYEPASFDPLRLATTLHYPTPNLEKIDIKTTEYYGPSQVNPLFIHPAPKLSVISVDTWYPIDQLLCRDQPLQYLGLEFAGEINLDYFPSSHLLGNLKHLCIKLHPFDQDTNTRTEEIFLPSLETLTIWDLAHGSDCIKAPRLETLRLFERFESELDLSRTPCFPSVRKVHYYWDIGKGDVKSFTTYIAQLQLLKEVAVLHRDEARVTAALSWMRCNSAYDDISLKGYQAEWDDLCPWSPPYPYECDEMKIYT